MTGLRETSVWLAINGVRRVTLACSPHDADALAAGHLLSEGWIGSVAELLSIEVVDGPGGATGVAAQINDVREAAALDLRKHLLLHGCGLRHVLDCERPAVIDRATPDLDSTALFRALFGAADAASPVGGVHAAALSDGATLLHTSYDVARHCAVDRAIGHSMRDSAPLAGRGLVLSSRISGAIASKCARAGIDWIASRSIATTLAHEIAAAFGITVIERAARAARDT